MKNTLRSLAVALLMLVSALSVSAHTNGLPRKTTPTPQQEQRLLEIQARVNEIKELDKSKLTKAEKKELRQELTSLKKEARRGGGIYISTLAIVVIVVLLVVLL